MESVRANQTAEQVLAAYLRGGRLPHALVIEGSAEETLDFAGKVAQGAVCSGEAKPCGICRDCVKAEKGVHPDILRYGGEGGARSFHIDTVRGIRTEAQIRSGEASCKVFVLEQAQNLSVQAQNALLKILEEPPKGVYFVLTCPNHLALLETIRSRTSVLALGETVSASEDVAAQAWKLLEQLCLGNELGALADLSALERDRPAFLLLLDALTQQVAALLTGSGEQTPEKQKIRTRTGRLKLLAILDIIEEIRTATEGNVSGLLLTTTLCCKVKLVLEG